MPRPVVSLSSQRIANRPLPKSHPRNRPSGATAKTPRPPIPGWLWMIAGVGGGILIMALLNLGSHKNASAKAGDDDKTEVIKPADERKTKTAEKPVEKPIVAEESKAADNLKAAEKPTTKFDFYTLLPEQEVIEPNERPTPPPAKIEKGQKPAAPAPVVANEAAPGEVFILQAGSFRSSAEADRRRAQVQALGLPSRQESVSAGGDTWYRVLVGPFPTRDAVAQARDKLAGQSIDTILVRKKTSG